MKFVCLTILVIFTTCVMANGDKNLSWDDLGNWNWPCLSNANDYPVSKLEEECAIWQKLYKGVIGYEILKTETEPRWKIWKNIGPKSQVQTNGKYYFISIKLFFIYRRVCKTFDGKSA